MNKNRIAQSTCKMMTAAISNIKFIKDFSIVLNGNIQSIQTKLNNMLMCTIHPFIDIYDTSQIFVIDTYAYAKNKNVKLLHFDRARIKNKITLPYRLEYSENDISSMYIRKGSFYISNITTQPISKYQLDITQIYDDKNMESLNKVFLEYTTLDINDCYLTNDFDLMFDIFKYASQTDLDTLDIYKFCI